VWNDDRTFSYEDSVTWNKGKHVWKFGGNGTAFNFHYGVIPNYGSFNFSGQFTGDGFADFLLGLPHSSSRKDVMVNRTDTTGELGFYAMDTFKVTPRLTLEYGLRWDYYGLPRWEDGLMYNFDLASGKVLVPQDKISLVNPLYPTNIPIAAGQVVSEASALNFRPRVSAAYMLGKGLVIRGGYGQYTQRFSNWYSDLADNQGAGPFAHLSQKYTNRWNSTTNQPLFSFPNPFPTSGGPNPAPSQTVLALPKKWDNGVIHQYNVSVEKEVAKMGLRASYIGSRSMGQNYIGSPTTWQWLDLNVPAPSAQPFDPSRLPYPYLAHVYAYRSDGEAKYDSLQLEATRKAGWVTFDAHYTWASSLNNMLNTDNVKEPTKFWAMDSTLRRNLIGITSVWKLPFGRGTEHLNQAPKALDTLVSGWSLQTISYFGSGDYLTPYFWGPDVANNNYNSFLPDVIPGKSPNLPRNKRSENRWFNTSVYHLNPDGVTYTYDEIGAFKIPGCSDSDPLCLNTSPANVGRFGNARVSSILGQPLDVHHLSIAKVFPITERVRGTFSTEIADLFNHPLFYDPDTYIDDAGVGQLVTARSDYGPEEAGHRQIAFKLRFEF
jgi:hypothetical protein